MWRKTWWVFLSIFLVILSVIIWRPRSGKVVVSDQNQKHGHQGEVAGVSVSEVIVSLKPKTVIPTISVSPTYVTTPPTSSSAQPTASPTPSSTPEPTPVIGLQNSDFSAGLQQWQTRGAVKVFLQPENERHDLPDSITHFARLASAQNLEWLGAHALEQAFTIQENHTSLEFWYRIHTEETELGFDSPSFVVLLNQQAVAWFSAVEASENWRHFVVSLPQTDQFITLSFIAGQTGDQAKATWVDVTNIKTSETEPTQANPDSPEDLRVHLSLLNNGSLALTAQSELLPNLESHTNFPPIRELLIPELAQQYSLQPHIWQPDGTTFQPSLTSPDFHTTSASYLTENFHNLVTQLNQLSDYNLSTPIKLWLTVKTALNQVIQLIPVDY